MKRLVDWVVAALIIVLCVWAYRASADDCQTRARLVEQLYAIPASERPAYYDELRYLAHHDRVVIKHVINAINWVEAGLSSEDAWRECGPT